MSHANHAHNPWTEHERETLRELWPTARSAAQIAEVLDGRSKNAIIGEAHRLKLPRKRVGPPRQPKPRKEKPPTPAKTFLFGKRLLPKPPAPGNDSKAAPRQEALLYDHRGFVVDLARTPPPKTAVEWAELTFEHCRWPYGDGKGIRFCGATHISGLPYCATHCRCAYRTPHAASD